MSKRDKRKGGRYTPPGLRPRPGTGDYRDPQTMGIRSASYGLAPDLLEELLRGATWPEQSAVLVPNPPVTGLPPMLVVMVGADEVDAGIRALLNARAACPDTQGWMDMAEGDIGWTTLSPAAGDQNQDMDHSFARLNVRMRRPCYEESFVFDLGQTLDGIAMMADGGLFAVASPDLLAYLGDKTYTDAVEALPVFRLPASAQLATLVERLRGHQV